MNWTVQGETFAILFRGPLLDRQPPPQDWFILKPRLDWHRNRPRSMVWLFGGACADEERLYYCSCMSGAGCFCCWCWLGISNAEEDDKICCIVGETYSSVHSQSVDPDDWVLPIISTSKYTNWPFSDQMGLELNQDGHRGQLQLNWLIGIVGGRFN